MKEHIDPISLFKQTNFSNTIWWKVKINISGYQNETENNLVTEIVKNRMSVSYTHLTLPTKA